MALSYAVRRQLLAASLPECNSVGECRTTVSRTLTNHAKNLLRWAIR